VRSPAVHIPGIDFEDELGRGAYSVVYRARQDGRPCAVKVPLVRGRWTRWFYREAVALARVHHPGLPAVLEVGEVDDLPYIVMELVEGEALADKLRRGPLGEEATLDLALHLVAALGAVHSVGLVHRDVKPRNIVVQVDGRMRLVDFGFATPIERAAREEDLAGTRGYAAPEQLRATARVDGRTDLYEVGRVILECLAERAPRAVPEKEVSDIDLLVASSRFAPLLAGLLAEDPDARYPGARALSNELERVRAGLPALGPSAYEQERHRTPLVGRNAELACLNRSWSSIGTASGSVVVVQGTRGCGKTKLLETCATTARTAGSCRVLEVRCREADPPLATLRRLFEAYAASTRRGTPAERTAAEDALRSAVGDQLAPFMRLIAPKLSDDLGLGPSTAEAAPGGFPEGAADLLVRVARRAGPLLMCIDDIHWIDPVSREAVLRVAQRVHEAPIALVLAARSDVPTPALDSAVAMDRSRFPVIEIAKLGEAQVAAHVASHLGNTHLETSLIRRIAALADGTPLGVLEVLGAFLDCGALRPQAGGWKLDVSRAERVALPDGALALLGRRLAELPPATRRVLEAAAVLGTTFDADLLARVVGLQLGDLEYGIADAGRAGLIESEERGRHRFVHDSLREMLVDALGAAEKRQLHQCIAELLDEGDRASFEMLCASALHYAAGEIERTPGRAYRAARAAADAALDRFDSETVLRFLELARVAAEVAAIGLDTPFYRTLGEAHLRLGALEESLHAFEAALDGSREERSRAVLLGRIAWVHQVRADPERAWSTLERAFAAVGARMPVENAVSVAATLGHLARAEVHKRARGRVVIDAKARADIELVCDLHYQNARLGVEYGKPFRIVQSTLEALKLSERLGPTRAQARARALYGFVVAALGSSVSGSREIATAQRMASDLADPITYAFCVQMQAMAACFAGELDRALVFFRECVDVHAPWLELNEYCMGASNGDFIESLRGRPTEAMAWNVRAIERQRQSHHMTVVSAEYLVHRARATLASLGRDVDSDPWLAAQVASVLLLQGSRQSFYHVSSWGPRVRFLLDSGNLGAEFEALVAAFEAEHHSPRSVHPVVAEYYIVVAHARIQQCRSARLPERRQLLRALRKALADLRLVAKLPLFKAHCVYVEGCAFWFQGATSKARAAFADAETLAEEETCPWILSEVAQARAYMLREEGKLDAARDRARFAEMLARQHGAEPRARSIRDEFGLPNPAASTRPPSGSIRSPSSSRSRRQLSALLHAVRRPSAEMGPAQQAASILDDLLRNVEAERGFISFQPSSSETTGLIVGRNRQGEAGLKAEAWHHALMESVREDGESWPPTDGASPDFGREIDATRVLAFPLFLYERVVGAVCVERSHSSAPFAIADRDMLLILSHQIPVAFEIARLMAEREQLQASLEQGHKMEAVGQLAGGVAHDFNNMLMAIRASLDLLGDRTGLEVGVKEELEIISSATQRAAQLTKQLLSFSRHQPTPLALCQMNDVISELAPMLRRLSGVRITIEVELDPSLHVVKIDRTSFDQVLVNLTINARDAMPKGGTMRIETKNVVLDEAAIRRGAPNTGDYVAVQVSDTGHGMSAEVLAHVFDPFFTTKPLGGGTGLGLTMVYAFAKNCGGYVEPSSDLGQGSAFRIYLPKAIEKVNGVAPRIPSPPKAVAGKAILIVDDDPFVRRMIRRTLERGGHHVFTAEGATEALELVQQQGSQIGVIILDVLMPVMTGPELGRRLVALHVAAKLLFISGFAPENLPPDADCAAEFLQKPFSSTDLLQRVQRLLGE
jgi:signal transduction histidine kinase/CheY-like chemotaxis protein/tetratricopeptide (TPR) repeat protein